MKIEQPQKQMTITFNEKELQFLREITQNSFHKEESVRNHKIRLELFVAVSRALGYNIDTQGNILR